MPEKRKSGMEREEEEKSRSAWTGAEKSGTSAQKSTVNYSIVHFMPSLQANAGLEETAK